jgi:hypothetical protein
MKAGPGRIPIRPSHALPSLAKPSLAMPCHAKPRQPRHDVRRSEPGQPNPIFDGIVPPMSVNSVT